MRHEGPGPVARGPKDFAKLVRRRTRHVVNAKGLAAIDRAELARGQRDGRPRAKLATVGELTAAAKGRRRTT